MTMMVGKYTNKISCDRCDRYFHPDKIAGVTIYSVDGVTDRYSLCADCEDGLTDYIRELVSKERK